MATGDGSGMGTETGPRAETWATLARAIVLSLSMAAALALATARPASAEPVPVRVGSHAGYGRLVFAWTQPVEYQASIQDGRLTVSFARALEIETQTALRVLSDYLKDAKAGEDGRSVSFALAGDFELKTFRNGSAVVVDLIDKTGSAPRRAATKSPQGAAPSSTAPATPLAPRVSVRVGIHVDKTRLVFDWAQPVSYSLDRQGETLTVFFDRPARFDLGRLADRPPPRVLAAHGESSETSAVLTLAIEPGSTLNHFRTGNRVVVDILSLPAEPPVPSVADARPAPQALTKQAPQAPGAQAPVTLEPPSAARPAPAGQPKAAAPPAAPPAASPAAPPGPATAAKPPPAAPPAASSSAAAAPTAPPADAGRPTSLVPGGPDVVIREYDISPPSGGEGTAARGEAGKSPVRSEATGPSVGVSLAFHWDEPTGIALFRRSGALWVVFDRASKQDLDAVKKAGGNVVRGVSQLAHENATVLRLDVIAGINPVPRRDGLSWILDFHRQPIDAINRLDVSIQPQTRGGRVLVTVADASMVFAVTDPEAGDNLLVVPTQPVSYGMTYPYSLSRFDLLATGQGIVVKPWTDTIQVRAVPQGVEITSPDGVPLSEVTAEDEAQIVFGLNRSLTRVLDLDKWRLQDLSTFVPRRQQLMLAIAGAKPGEEREKARMDLARFYFSNSAVPEALVVLDLIAADRAAAADTPEFRLIRGGCRYLMGRIEEAREDFAFKGLDGIDEGAFWRAIVETVAGDKAAAARELRRVGPIVRFYPRGLGVPLGLTVAETAIDLGDLKVAIFYLESLIAAQPTPPQRAYIDYLEGRIFEAAGDFEKAVERWTALGAGPDRLVRFLSSRDRIELQLKLKELTLADAIEDMESLRYAWRGDEMEFALLRRLGSLYLEEKDYRGGLFTLREAATIFRENPRAPEVTQQMADVFARLFLNDEAKALQPITAIALFEEFRELTPVGVRGDEMIRKLADRLTSVDLLDRAEELLRGQIEFRLKGAEKARVGAQLVLIHLLNGKPDEALKTLRASDEPDLPADLVAQRRHLAARAMMAKGEGDAALLALKEDLSPDAERLKAEIYWNAQDWDRAVQALQRLLRAIKAEPRRALNKEQAGYVFNAAVAMVLAGNERGVARLRLDYGDAMEKSEYAKGFDLISGQGALDGVKRDELPEEVKEAQGFQNFLTAYKERLKAQGLSGIN